MTRLSIGKRGTIEISRPCGDDRSIPREGLQEPERILSQLFRKKQLDVIEKNDPRRLIANGIVENAGDSHGALAVCQIQKFLGKVEIDIETRPIVSCRKVRKCGSFARAGRPYRQNQLVISVLYLGQNVLDL